MGWFDSKHRFVRKADAIKHEKDSHSGIVYKCSKWCALIIIVKGQSLISPAVVANPLQIRGTQRGMNNHAVPSSGYTVSVIVFYAGYISAGLVRSREVLSLII